MPFLSFCTEIVSRHVGKWLIQKVFSGSAYYTRLGKLDSRNPINLPITFKFLSLSTPLPTFPRALDISLCLLSWPHC